MARGWACVDSCLGGRDPCRAGTTFAWLEERGYFEEINKDRGWAASGWDIGEARCCTGEY